MATYTEKLGLKLPAQTDFYNIDDFNENFRKIDGLAVLRGTTAPTTATVGIIGQFYFDTGAKMLYQCVSAEGGVYEWFNITLDSSIGLSPDVATALGLTGNPQVKDALEKIKTLVDTAQTTANGRAQIATGSYTGTETYGVSSPVNLVFPFVPKVVFMSSIDTNGRIISPTTSGSINELSSFVMDCGSLSTAYSTFCQVTSNVKIQAKKSSDGKTISFYSDTSARAQCNSRDMTYYHTAIG